MILQSLTKRYNDTLESANTAPFGWAYRDAVYALDLDENGNLHQLLLLEMVEDKKRIRPQFLLPEEPTGRTVAIKPAFLCDNCMYVFGLSEKANGREKLCFDKAKEYYNHILKDVKSTTAQGVLNYYNKWEPDNALQNVEVMQILSNKKTSNVFYKCRFVFQVNGKFAHNDLAVKQVWNNLRMSADGEQIRCLVTGNYDFLTRLHGKVALRGVSMGSVPLVSINAESFTSYGKRKDEPPAQVGEKSAFAYVTALNSMLKDNNHHKWLGSDTVVYWSEEGEKEAQTYSWLGDPKESDNSKLNAVMEKYVQGNRLDINGCKMDSSFYILCLSPNAGRISVRFFYQSIFKEVVKNILSHYNNLEIVKQTNEKFLYLPPWIILSETTVKKKVEDAAPLLGGQLMQCIINGGQYPMTLYMAVLMRIRAGEYINRTKAAIIKAILIRNYNEREVTSVSLNENSENAAYVLGRLFAVLERLQQESSKQKSSDNKLNSTIRDKYFATACSNPITVFPSILKLSMHHTSKLDKPNEIIFFEKMKGEITDKLSDDSPFPAALTLEEQGKFIIGYYHQRQAFYTPKKQEEETINV